MVDAQGASPHGRWLGAFHGLHFTLRAALVDLARLGVVSLGREQMHVRVWRPDPEQVRLLLVALDRAAAAATPLPLSDVVREPTPHVAADALQWLLYSDPEAPRTVAAECPENRGSRFWAIERARALQDAALMVALLRIGSDPDEAEHALGTFPTDARLRMLAALSAGPAAVLEGATRWLPTQMAPGDLAAAREVLRRIGTRPVADRRELGAVPEQPWHAVAHGLGPDDVDKAVCIASVAQGGTLQEVVDWLAALPPRPAAPSLQEAELLNTSSPERTRMAEALDALRRPGALSIVEVGLGGLSLAPGGTKDP